MFYKAVMNGSYQGNRISNILYYRTGIGVDLDGVTLGGSKELGGLIKSEVWSKLKVIVPAQFKMDDITVYPLHDGTFDLAYQNPYIEYVNEFGTNQNETDGPAMTAILKFNLEPTIITLNGAKPPKRGYLAVGPIVSVDVDNTGHLIDGIFSTTDNSHKNFAAAVSSNLTSILPPVVFYPVRVRQDKILGLLKIVSFADVSGAAFRRKVSFRRSRLPEF